MKPKKRDDFENSLIKRLKNTDYALGYLNACLQDKDEGTFLLGLKYVAEAHGGMRKLAQKAHLNREHLFRMLSKNGNPRLGSLQEIAEAFGWTVSLARKTKSRHLKHAAPGRRELVSV